MHLLFLQNSALTVSFSGQTSTVKPANNSSPDMCGIAPNGVKASVSGPVSKWRESRNNEQRQSLCSLHFTSQGKGPRVEDPRQGAPFPSLAEEGALGSSAVGVVPLGYSNWRRALGGTSPRP